MTSSVYLVRLVYDRHQRVRFQVTAPNTGVAIASALTRLTPSQRDTVTRVEIVSATPLPQEATCTP